jgi:2-polyprenyl-6-methoxyphenol hydroxylase-like FAD-dependent oxidoreductase
MTVATQTQEHANAAAYQRSLKELPAPVETIDQEKYDVVIIGAGPAGLFSGSALARFGWNVLVVDNRSEPTIAGRAGMFRLLSALIVDGVQPRTIEVLKNMAPIGQEMTARGARCYERTFWVLTPRKWF